jgi:hypothetical protein
MKPVKLFEEFIDPLFEIGDATLSVPYHKKGESLNSYKDEKTIDYEFEIGDSAYIVSLYTGLMDKYDVPQYKSNGEYYLGVVFGNKVGNNDFATLDTNRGEQYRIMATVTKILKDYVTQHPEVVEIVYEPVKSGPSDRGREKLYKAYVDKNLSGWSYTKDSHNHVYLRKPSVSSKSNVKHIFNKHK